jgi:SNF2 family DNA or RNA helicase
MPICSLPAKEMAAVNLWNHQQDAVEWAWGRAWALLHHGMGSGKTLTTLALILRCIANLSATRILVCCPKAVMPAWAKQVSLWCPHVRIVLLDGSTKARKQKQFANAMADLSPVIVVINYESAWRMDELEKQKWDVLVWDEVHRLKAPSGAASRWAGRMTKKNPKARRYGLSGTLIPHSILDVWAIYRSLESPECTTFGQTYTLHRAKYAVMNPHQPGMVVAYKNLPEAHAKIAATTHHVKSADVLDLPPIQFIDEPVEMSAGEARLYREVEREFCGMCEAGIVSPKNALEQLLRLQQICGGYVRFDGEATAKQISDGNPAKAARFADMLEDSPQDEPFVVFCRFTSDILAVRAAATAAARTVSELSGARNELAAWQAGKTGVLIAQIQSGGIGIDLTRAAYAVFYSLGYSLAEYEQAVARLHRPGQERRTVIYHLTATANGRATVDGRVYEALRERREVVNAIIDGFSRAAPAGAR